MILLEYKIVTRLTPCFCLLYLSRYRVVKGLFHKEKTTTFISKNDFNLETNIYEHNSFIYLPFQLKDYSSIISF